MDFKSAIKRRMPAWGIRLYSTLVWSLIIRPKWKALGHEGVFVEHYRKNGWGSPESRSGEGSTLQATLKIRELLPTLVTQLQVRTLLDIPCGDFHWMKTLELSVSYIGADIVPELVATNQNKFSRPDRVFLKLDLINDPLPLADLILCRDCLFHFSYEHAHRAIENMVRSGATYLLTTSNPNHVANADIVTGEWRPLNLQAAPFSFPEPLLLIAEDSHDQPSAKSICLWRLSELPQRFREARIT